MGYCGDKNIMRDMKENLKDLKTKMIDMAQCYIKDGDELEEYIDKIERILKI